MPKDQSIKSVLIIGSGPIIIGQACEFDYSGSQAARSLREEGIKVILINSNPATIMTDPMMADRVYLLPLNVESIEQILQENNIDAVLPTMGGQTALNLCKEADELGIWEKYNCRLIGVDVAAIDTAEDREQFRQLMVKIGMAVAPSRVANSFLEGKEFAQEIGFPLVIRPSFTLGGTGGGFVHGKEDLDAALEKGLKASPIHEVLVEKAVLGWKEYELELLRDCNDNVVIICTVENLDPMGVHTGDSITVAPAMTLSDTAFQEMRNKAMLMMRSLGNFAGGCNVQFALNPATEELIAVEINPRVSRSSALASKATGYPIAKIAAKLAIGYSLDELKNFRQWRSKTPGHPEFGLTPGVETTTGPLGQGFANAVGMAIAQAFLAANFNQSDLKILDHYIYGICSDGDLIEGISHEAASLAGHLKLNKIIFFYDNNGISIDGKTSLAYSDDVQKRFEAYNWNVLHVRDVNDVDEIETAIQSAQKSLDKPTLIITNTHIGFGSPNKQDTSEAHGSPLGEEEVKLSKKNLGWRYDELFYVPQEVRDHFKQVKMRGEKQEVEWQKLFDDYKKKYPDKAKQLLDWIAMRGSVDPKVKIKTYVAIPYNPYEPEPYDRWTLQGLFDLDQEVLVGNEFWDFLGGQGTYEDLLQVFEEAGIELRSEIDQKMKII